MSGANSLRRGRYAPSETTGHGSGRSTVGKRTLTQGLGPQRGALEAAFGKDLGDVAVHSGDDAGEVTASEGAPAVALGQEVWLSAAAREDPFIIAHEVAHTVQQRGGTGGEGDPEQAADAAAGAFLAGQRAPAQPPAPTGVARFQGATPVRAPTPVTTRGWGTGGPVAHGQRRAADGAGPLNAEIERLRSIKDKEIFIDRVRDHLEKPTISTATGGAAPKFVTKEDPATQPTQWQGDDTVEITFVPHRFHVLTAIEHDVQLAETVDEIESLWKVYLLDTPRQSPWGRERERKRVDDASPWDSTKCSPEPGPTVGSHGLPDGAAAFGLLPVVGWVNIHAKAEDPDGTQRETTLIRVIGRRAREVHALADLMPGTDPRDLAIDKTRNQEADRRAKRVVPTLWLPNAKAPHLYRYMEKVGSRKLVHDKKYARGRTAQESKWTTHVLARLAGRPDLIEEGQRLAGSVNRIILPNWTRSREDVKMHVDHIVELQVTLPEDRDEFDHINNYELLDKRTNESSGSRFKNLIKRERMRLRDETGDESWMEKRLVFEEVALAGEGPLGERWSEAEISNGVHIAVLKALRRT
jgi:hypothetical protein